MAALSLDRVTRFYGPRRGVEDLSLEVAEGSLFGFLGPNGAGKTTTIRVLLGFLRPNAGTAKIFGLDCWSESKAVKRDVGYLPADLRLPSWMTTLTALSIFGAVRGRDLLSAGRELANEFDLETRVKVREMSRGMRQKVGLILALAHAPRLLVLDEPSTGLDPLMQQTLHRILRRMASSGHTIFFSSHSLGEVEQLCNDVAIVREGKLVAHESLAALRQRAGHDVVIRWKSAEDAARIEPPPFLKIGRRAGAMWHGVLDGPADGLVEFLAGKPLEELNVSRPDLESLFHRFYEQDKPPLP